VSSLLAAAISLHSSCEYYCCGQVCNFDEGVDAVVIL
jgi:hypothetical protein